MASFIRKPIPFAEAAEWIRSKPVLAKEAFYQLLPSLRARAFTVSGLPSFEVAQNIRDRIAELPEGALWRDVKRDVADRLIPYFVDPEAEVELQDKQRLAAFRRAELLLRTNGFQAYQAASHEMMTRQADVLPYWQYLSMEDGRVRPGHAALNGLVLPADSPFWKTHYPPWEWNCRCQVAPLSPEDVARLEERDAGKPADERRVLTGARLRELESGNRVLRAGMQFDVTPPTERPGAETAFVFDPEALRIPLKDLQRRYDPEVFTRFEAWAKRARVDAGKGEMTVWGWLNGEPPTFVPRAAGPGPESTTITAPVRPASQAELPAVSAALDVQIADKDTRDEVTAAIAVIDRTHKDGKLPTISITGDPGADSLGAYFHNIMRKAVRIGIRGSGPWPQLTTAHEVGHFIDHQALDVPGLFASERSGLMKEWRRAVRKSDAYKQIKEIGLRTSQKRYYLKGRECFARSYAQWIATRSADGKLLADVQRVLDSHTPWRQWQSEDFKPIAKAFDDLFKAKGWL